MAAAAATTDDPFDDGADWGDAEPASPRTAFRRAKSPGASRSAANAAVGSGDAPLPADGASEDPAGEPDAQSEPSGRRRARRARSSESKSAKPKPKLTRTRVALYAAAVLVALALVVVGTFSWSRWLCFNDTQDIQGTWTVAGAQGGIVIDGELIHLTDVEAYRYTLDSGAKTLTFTFGDLEGSARYRFSADRTQLVIQDGSFSFTDTLFDDIAWSWRGLVAMFGGQPAPDPSFGEGSLVLQRSGEVPAADADASGSQSAGDDAAAGSGDGAASDGSASDGAGDDAGGAATDGADGQAADDGSADADQQAAQDEAQRQEEEENQQAAKDALSLSGHESVGSNAVSPEDLM